MIRNLIGGVLICMMVLFIACSEEQRVTVFSLSYLFKDEDQGWIGDFADYPEGDSIAYELFFKHDTLPENLNVNATIKGLHLAGKNQSDDLFMFVKKKVTGLRPNTTFQILFSVRLASDAPTGSVGIGGAPGEDVYLKVGATLIEPKKELEAGVYRMNIDKGNQGVEGTDMINIGHIGVASTTTKFAYITRTSSSTNKFTVTTDDAGELWIIVGTDSGYEGETTLYYTQIDIYFNEAD